MLRTVAGLMAGFYRGWVENVIMRVTDVFLSVPTVLSGLALAAIIGTNVLGLVVIITALYWAWTCRVVFGETLSLRRRTFVEAAIAAGVPGDGGAHLLIREGSGGRTGDEEPAEFELELPVLPQAPRKVPGG